MSSNDTRSLAVNEGAGGADPSAPFAGISPEELAGQRPVRRKGSTQVIILVLVLSVSAVSLWWMRREGTRVGVNFQELKVEYTEPDAEKARTYQRIMADLARVQNPLDVALGEFGKSPFMLDTGTATISEHSTPMSTGPSAEELAAREAAERAEARRQELLSTLANLRLQSVMGGASPLARIDDRTVRVGDVVGRLFTVTAIEGRSVTLTADDQMYTLTMDDRRTDQPRRAPVRMGTPAPRTPTRPSPR
jgi:ribosomal protein L29